MKNHWRKVIKKLAGRERLLRGRKLLEQERRALLALIVNADAAGWSLKEIAEAAGCSYPNVYQFFTGQHGVSLAHLHQYTTIIGVEFRIEFDRVRT